MTCQLSEKERQRETKLNLSQEIVHNCFEHQQHQVQDAIVTNQA